MYAKHPAIAKRWSAEQKRKANTIGGQRLTEARHKYQQSNSSGGYVKPGPDKPWWEAQDRAPSAPVIKRQKRPIPQPVKKPRPTTLQPVVKQRPTTPLPRPISRPVTPLPRPISRPGTSPTDQRSDALNRIKQGAQPSLAQRRQEAIKRKIEHQRKDQANQKSNQFSRITQARELARKRT